MSNIDSSRPATAVSTYDAGTGAPDDAGSQTPAQTTTFPDGTTRSVASGSSPAFGSDGVAARDIFAEIFEDARVAQTRSRYTACALPAGNGQDTKAQSPSIRQDEQKDPFADAFAAAGEAAAQETADPSNAASDPIEWQVLENHVNKLNLSDDGREVAGRFLKHAVSKAIINDGETVTRDAFLRKISANATGKPGVDALRSMLADINIDRPTSTVINAILRKADVNEAPAPGTMFRDVSEAIQKGDVGLRGDEQHNNRLSRALKALYLNLAVARQLYDHFKL